MLRQLAVMALVSSFAEHMRSPLILGPHLKSQRLN
jgi:hypothetical protein